MNIELLPVLHCQDMEIGVNKKRVTKIIKRVYDYSYREKLEKLRLTIFLERRMRGDQIETIKIMEFLIIVDSFLINFLNCKFTVLIDFKNQVNKKLDCFANWVIYFWIKLPNQRKNSKKKL